MEVVSASHGVFGPLLGKLTSLLADKYAHLKGVRREIRSLRSELISMQAAVHKYSTLQDPDVQVKAWISLVRELAYDTEDVIDKFFHHLGNGSKHHGGFDFKEFFRKTARSLKTLGSRRRIANQIDELKARVKEVTDLKSRYKLDDIASSTIEHSVVDPRLSALFVEEEHLVGIDGPRDDLVNWMLEEKASSTKHRKVLSIVGFGGLGKTTLAKEVCGKIPGHFHCQAFVSISQKPNVKKIMKDLISQVPCKKEFIEDIDTWDEKKFIAQLKELLQHKRYLIVIDDIWSISAWEAIKYAFPENNLSSRIIATTRIVDVARSCCSHANDRVYEMEALSDLHSKRLFFKRIFGSQDCCPDVLKQVSDKILKKCGGFNVIKSSLSAVEELGNLTALEQLYLQLDGRGSQEYKRHEEMLLSSLCKLGRCKLQSLCIDSEDSTPLQFLDSWSPLPASLQTFRMSTNYYYPKMPKWIVPELSSLAYLNINLLEITEDVLRILGEMRALLSLVLAVVVQKERIIVRGHLFPCLKEFRVPQYHTWATYLKFEEGAMPKLEKLGVPLFVSAAKDYGFNLGIDHLPCLKHAEVRLENEDATYSENKAAAAAIRKEANAHPNHPRVFIDGEMEEKPEETDTNEEESCNDEEES